MAEESGVVLRCSMMYNASMYQRDTKILISRRGNIFFVGSNRYLDH
jgi:hypothetical protein